MAGYEDRLLVAVYSEETEAQHVIERLSAMDFPLDMISVLGRAHHSGDDVLGISYAGPGERVKLWAKQGAFWGALWGTLAGAGAFFTLPSIGPILAAGPIVDALVSVVAGGIVGGATGAAVGGSTLSGAAAATHLGVLMHRMGIPHDTLERLHHAIEAGHYLVLLRIAKESVERWKTVLDTNHATEVMELPYARIQDLG